ncbi:hypothetical protein CTI12_AA369430 [Artemisia annua]|uniref:Uncharacterized protein n=1 Tax=Artemisia annua TaxID=35608 RepID=A0A2U1MKM2_ARTAN|nr:hypothetical protein CTI12_AA369430 [Artemisia annua]
MVRYKADEEPRQWCHGVMDPYSLLKVKLRKEFVGFVRCVRILSPFGVQQQMEARLLDYSPTDSSFVLKKRSIKGRKPYDTTTLSDAQLRGTKKVAGGFEESKNEMLKTTANSSNRRKAVETSSCQSVSSQLDECQEETDEEDVVDQKVEHALMYIGRKVDAVKKDSAMQKNASTVKKPYSMRHSTRMTEKKSTETMVNKDSRKAVKIDSFMDDELISLCTITNLLYDQCSAENTNAVVEDPKGMAGRIEGIRTRCPRSGAGGREPESVFPPKNSRLAGAQLSQPSLAQRWSDTKNYQEEATTGFDGIRDAYSWELFPSRCIYLLNLFDDSECGSRVPVNQRTPVEAFLPIDSNSVKGFPKDPKDAGPPKARNKRFLVPLAYLRHPSFQALLNLAQDEFGDAHPMGGRENMVQSISLLYFPNRKQLRTLPMYGSEHVLMHMKTNNCFIEVSKNLMDPSF